jgi:hypothetical protein
MGSEVWDPELWFFPLKEARQDGRGRQAMNITRDELREAGFRRAGSVLPDPVRMLRV